MGNLSHIINNLTVEHAQAADNLTLFPLIDPEAKRLPYDSLDSALARNTIEISEVSAGGSVPELLVTNKGAQPVFLLDGEELVGCKQNRVLNLSVLVPAKSTLKVPVSCVEQGRWDYHSDKFDTSSRAQFARGRAKKVARVSASLKEGNVRSGDQGEIWEDVAMLHDSLGTESATGAMAAAYEQKQQDLDRYESGFEVLPGQVGAVFAVNGRVIGAEILGSPELYQACHRKVVNSYAMDALANFTRVYPVAQNLEAKRFLDDASRGQMTVHPAIGLGEDVRLESKQYTGAMLTNDGRLVHGVMFELNDQENGNTPTRNLRR